MPNAEKFDYEKYMWEEKTSCSYFLTQGFNVLFGLIGVVIGSVCLFFGLLISVGIGLNLFDSSPPLEDIARLDIATIDDLCFQFNLSPEDRLCSHNEPVYGDDFYPIIKDEFKIYFTTYEDIQAKLAPYQIRRDDPKTEKNKTITSFFATYDLAGDGESFIVFRLNRDDVLHDMIFHYINRNTESD